MKTLIGLMGLLGVTAVAGDAAAGVGSFVTGKGKCEGHSCRKAKARTSPGTRLSVTGKAGAFAGVKAARATGKAEGWAGVGAGAKTPAKSGAAGMATAVVPGGTILSAALSGAGKASSTAAALKAPRKLSGPKYFPGPNWKGGPKHFPGPNWKGGPKSGPNRKGGPKYFPGPNWKPSKKR